MSFKLIDIQFSIENQRILYKKNLDLPEGQHVLIYGPSGSGKTTLINLMAGLIKPTKGKIFFKDIDYSFINDSELDNLRKEKFGFIFQKLHLIEHLNVEQNISLGQNIVNHKELSELIDILGLSAKKKSLARYLSLGESQRVAIARGLIKKPEVIFADEPTSALDDDNAKKFIELILSETKKNKTTVIISSHDGRIKKYFSNVFIVSR